MRNLLVTTRAAGALLSASSGSALADPGDQLELDIAAVFAAGTLSGEGEDEIDDSSIPDLPFEGGCEMGGAEASVGQDGGCSADADYDPSADLIDPDCISAAD